MGLHHINHVVNLFFFCHEFRLIHAFLSVYAVVKRGYDEFALYINEPSLHIDR